LTGLAEHRCPECGRGFDPADDRTYFPVERRVEACRRDLRSAKAAAVFAPIAAVLIAAFLLFVDPDSKFFEVGSPIVSVFALAAPLLGVYSLGLIASVFLSPRPCREAIMPEALRTIVTALLLGAFAITILLGLWMLVAY